MNWQKGESLRKYAYEYGDDIRVNTKAIIVAAGSSSRMQGHGKRLDKQFAEIAGRPLLAWTIEAFQNAPSVNEIFLILSQENILMGRELVNRYGFSKVTGAWIGGTERKDSVSIGLALAEGSDIIAVHDGARPCITSTDIERGISLVRDDGLPAAVAVSPIIDTIKAIVRIEHKGEERMLFTGTVDREALVAASTPQIFNARTLKIAHSRFRKYTATDDAQLVELIGEEVFGYECTSWNGKVTRQEDLVIAEAVLLKRKS
jgi:2-C-methyl-D-erythritol 4-phosphate cytidylyltransferase